MLVPLLVLAAAGLLAGSLSLRLSPTRRCRCADGCRRCRGTGRRFRTGVALVHRKR